METKVLKKNIFFIIGILILLIGFVILADANNKVQECESIGSKVVQMFSEDIRGDCANVQTYKVFGYVGIVLGVGLILINFVVRR